MSRAWCLPLLWGVALTAYLAAATTRPLLGLPGCLEVWLLCGCAYLLGRCQSGLQATAGGRTAAATRTGAVACPLLLPLYHVAPWLGMRPTAAAADQFAAAAAAAAAAADKQSVQDEKHQDVVLVAPPMQAGCSDALEPTQQGFPCWEQEMLWAAAPHDDASAAAGCEPLIRSQPEDQALTAAQLRRRARQQQQQAEGAGTSPPAGADVSTGCRPDTSAAAAAAAWAVQGVPPQVMDPPAATLVQHHRQGCGMAAARKRIALSLLPAAAPAQPEPEPEPEPLTAGHAGQPHLHEVLPPSPQAQATYTDILDSSEEDVFEEPGCLMTCTEYLMRLDESCAEPDPAPATSLPQHDQHADSHQVTVEGRAWASHTCMFGSWKPCELAAGSGMSTPEPCTATSRMLVSSGGHSVTASHALRRSMRRSLPLSLVNSLHTPRRSVEAASHPWLYTAGSDSPLLMADEFMSPMMHASSSVTSSSWQQRLGPGSTLAEHDVATSDAAALMTGLLQQALDSHTAGPEAPQVAHSRAAEAATAPAVACHVQAPPERRSLWISSCGTTVVDGSDGKAGSSHVQSPLPVAGPLPDSCSSAAMSGVPQWPRPQQQLNQLAWAHAASLPARWQRRNSATWQTELTAPSSTGASRPSRSTTHVELPPQGCLPTHLQLQQGALSPLQSAPLLAEWHDNISIVFGDIVGFTSMAQQVHPQRVMQMLDALYIRFDELCLASGRRVYKVETIGDCYMAATGLLTDDPDHATTALRFALAMREQASQVLTPDTQQPVRMHIGVHSGRAMSGIVGRLRRRYCLFGDTVNTASRMESLSSPGCIHISSDTHALASAHPAAGTEFVFRCRGQVGVKGKGEMTTWWVEGHGAHQVGPQGE